MDNGLIVLVVVMVFFTFLLILVTSYTKPKLNKSHYRNQWEKIMKEKSAVACIVAADNLVDEAMKKLKIRGQTMGERLNNSEAFIREINSVWSAHKLRNKMVHESNVAVPKKEVANSLIAYKKALKDLGAL